MVGTTRRPRSLSAALTMVAAATVLAACQGISVSPSNHASTGATSSATSGSSSATSAPAQLSISPADHASDILPTQPITVKAMTGKVDRVTVASAKGSQVAGSTDATGTWTSTGRLAPNTAYTITTASTGPDGASSTTTSTFTTLKPKVVATYGILNSGQTVGIGMPASIQFDTPVTTKALRAQVEKLVKVTTAPAQSGSWGWLDSRQLMWRPATYWQPGTKVTVDAPLTGVQTGPDKWIEHDDHASFTVGSAMVSSVNIQTHMMTVTRGGQVVRTIPVSTGRPGPLTETRSGIKVIIRKEGKVTMDSATVGIPKGNPNYYKIDTQWNLRLTWTGEYIHSAPWSVNSQGTANVSHGCTNMSPANAQWMFDNSKVGDIVVFTGSSRPFLPTEGIGVWQYTFAAWQKQSALV
ncbi:MAG TPA: Ig-like domain-containing protein [Pedococcus sp.]|nr:Ig-like domain-containing protein [Pedococcus sp.]